MKSNVSTTYRQNVHERFTFAELEHFSCHDKLLYRASGIEEISTKKNFNRDPLTLKYLVSIQKIFLKSNANYFFRKQTCIQHEKE